MSNEFWIFWKSKGFFSSVWSIIFSCSYSCCYSSIAPSRSDACCYSSYISSSNYSSSSSGSSLWWLVFPALAFVGCLVACIVACFCCNKSQRNRRRLGQSVVVVSPSKFAIFITISRSKVSPLFFDESVPAYSIPTYGLSAANLSATNLPAAPSVFLCIGAARSIQFLCAKHSSNGATTAAHFHHQLQQSVAKIRELHAKQSGCYPSTK